MKRLDASGARSLSLTLVAVAFLAVQVFPQESAVTWDGGGGDGRWSTAANWNGDVLPGPTSDVIIRDAGIVHVDVDVTVNSIVFGSANTPGDDTLLVDVGRTLTIRATRQVNSNLYADVTIGGSLVVDPTARVVATTIGPGTFINNGEVRINDWFFDQQGGTFLNQGRISVAGGALRVKRGTALNLGEIVLSNDALLQFEGEGDASSTTNGFTNALPGRIRGLGKILLGHPNPTVSPLYQVPFINRGTIAVSTEDHGGTDNFSILTTTAIQNHGSIGPSGAPGAVAVIGIDCHGDVDPRGTLTVPIEMACYTWVGRGVTGNWSDPLNWTAQEPPSNATSRPILLQPAPVQPQLDVDFVANGDVIMLAGTTLTVLPGRSLTLSGETDNSGVLANFGQVTIGAPAGVLTNDGSIQNEGGMRNDGTLMNNGVLTTSGSFYNTSEIENHAHATLANSGIFINDGAILNTGTVTNAATLHTSGTFDNQPNSTFTNTGHLANSGSFVVACDVAFVPGSTSGTLTMFCATWDGGGGDGRWSTAANWVGDTLPGPTNDAVLENAGIVHVDVDVTVNSIVFGDQNVGDDTLLVDVGRTLTIRTTRARDSHFREDTTIGGSLVFDPTARIVSTEIRSGTFINNGEIHINDWFFDQEGGTFLNQGRINVGNAALRVNGGMALNLGEIVLSNDALLQFEGQGDEFSTTNGFTNALPGRIRGIGLILLGHPNPTVSPDFQAPFINRGTIAVSVIASNDDFSIENHTLLFNLGSIGPGPSGVAGISNLGEVRNACGATITVPVTGNPIVQQSCNTPPTVSAGANQTIEAMAPLTPVVLAGVASDADGDQLAVQWRDSSGALLASARTVNLQLPLGTHVFTFQADDGNGGTTSDTVQVIVQDTTLPAISATRSPEANAHGWNNESVLVNFTCTDAVSGISVVPVDVTVSAQGANRSATASCRDGAGNLASLTISGINIDKTAPVVTATRLTPPNARGWNRTPVVVQFDATDTLSGIDGDSTEQRQLDTEGADQHAGASFSDLAGNVGTATASNIDIDLTAPVLEAVRTPLANANGWNNTAVSIDFSCDDALSGVLEMPSDRVLGAEGSNQSASASCRDAADNVATLTEGGINIDWTPPLVTATADRPADSNDWYRDPFTVTWSGVDTLSGIASCSAPTAYAGPDMAAASLSGSCNDKAGNTVAAQHEFRYDATPPAITIGQPADGGAYLLNQSVAAAYSCADLLSGVSTCAGPVASGAAIATGVVGPQTFTVQAMDPAGNTTIRTHSYAVRFVFDGFLSPLNNLPTMNRGPAGRTFTVRWRLLDGNGASISDPASIAGLSLTQAVCGTSATDVSDGGSIADEDDLKYDPSTGTWRYQFRTERSQAGCWILQLHLSDGSVQPIGFELR